jgi:hypothetical protein
MSQQKYMLQPWLSTEGGASDGTGILIDTHSGTMSSCNDTAWVLLESLKTGATEEQLVDALLSNFTVSEDEARRDLHRFFLHLSALQLIDEAT